MFIFFTNGGGEEGSFEHRVLLLAVFFTDCLFICCSVSCVILYFMYVSVMEDSNIKVERSYSPGKVPHVYLFNHIKILLWSHIKFLFKSTEKVGIISKTTFAEHFRDG